MIDFLNIFPYNFATLAQSLVVVDLILELAFFFSVNHIDWFNFSFQTDNARAFKNYSIYQNFVEL